MAGGARVRGRDKRGRNKKGRNKRGKRNLKIGLSAYHLTPPEHRVIRLCCEGESPRTSRVLPTAERSPTPPSGNTLDASLFNPGLVLHNGD
jgi:hypothetical protein